MRLFVTLSFFLLFSLVAGAQSTNYGLDVSFGDRRIAGTLDYTNRKFRTPTGLIIQPDGKILISGNLLGRYLTTGRPDSSFAVNGFFVPPFTDLDQPSIPVNVIGIALQPDGKILAIGKPDTDCFFILRLHSDGRADSSFGTIGFIRYNRIDPKSIQLQPDGKILVIGTGCGGSVNQDSLALGRFHADGSPDSTFGSEGYVHTYMGNYGGSISGFSTLPDGRIALAGIGHEGAYVKMIVIRYLANGTPDLSLGGSGQVFPLHAWYCHAAAILPDGRIVITISDGTTEEVTHLLQDGTIDTSFGQSGFVGIAGMGITSLLPLSDGRILCGGIVNGDYAIASLRANGKSIDSAFGRNGIITTDITGYHQDHLDRFARQTDGKIIGIGNGVTTARTTAGVVLVRYMPEAATGIEYNTYVAAPVIAISPNPAHSRIRISGLRPEDIAAVELLSADGRLTGPIAQPPDGSVSLASIPSGLYLLRIVTRSGQPYTRRIVISE